MTTETPKTEPIETEWNDAEFDHYFLALDYRIALCGYLASGSDPIELKDLPARPCPICVALHNFP